ncbi:UDP-galactose transporter [Xylogone sp. PMI_703]|nr:UDP-galactose transporter [Xylogone sp. PMI_703]
MIQVPRLSIRHRLSWLHRPQSQAYVAALGLVSIQVGIGIIMKAAQRGGTYTFSPSSSVTISEFCKMLLSTLFYYRECSKIHTQNNGQEIFSEETKPLSAEDEEEQAYEGENGETSSAHRDDIHMNFGGIKPKLRFRQFWKYIKNVVSRDIRYGFAQLALFYALINNTNFVSYKVADPGTIQLTKSGVTFITALVMTCTLSSKITKIQWIAIVIQLCGLVVTQYHPETGASYPFSTYLILLFQVLLSSLSGVYNQALLKAENASLHADNMILYAAGTVINLLLHITIKVFKADEPGFLSGYGSIDAIMVIISNIFIGLAMTAVYKYADAVIKCFATAVSTGILLYLSPIFFNAKLSFLTLPGTIVVFIASWLYVEGAPPKDSSIPPQKDQSATLKRNVFSKIDNVVKLHRKIVLSSATVLTIIIVVFLTMLNSSIPNLANHDVENKEPSESSNKPVLTSPFSNTLAVVRWNSYHPERIPLISKYAPFFHDIHFSMPGYGKKKPDLTHDPSGDIFHIYLDVAKSMQLVLDAPANSRTAEIDGILFFHFDAWIDPLAFNGANMNNIWFPDVVDLAPPGGGGPRFLCTNNTEEYNWWAINEGLYLASIAASTVVEHFNLDYTVDTSEWCTGWSDIYYIPKRFFADFIFLSSIFGRFSVFHEIATPTIVHIIDESRRRHPTRGILDRLGDCWGSCCANDPSAHEILTRRCGHRLNYLQEDITMVHYDRLDAEAAMLGDLISEVQYTGIEDLSNRTFSFETLESFTSDSGLVQIGMDANRNPILVDHKALKTADHEMDKLVEQRAKNIKSGRPPPGTPDGVFDTPVIECSNKTNMSEIHTNQRRENIIMF